ncbi:MAG TPA: type II secretion system F family protein [Patescibacteria group bacterium]|jgi:protein transport protein HofC|nr:type II secretion system F family protein [Patescibacteria group bacterium]
MPLIITPGQFTQRADFYHQLGQLTAAGIPLPTALEHLRHNSPNRTYSRIASRLLEKLAEGCTFTDSLRAYGSWLPEFDIALLQAGEHSGRLDSCFRLLGDYYADRARLTRQVIADLMYPAFLFHFAIFILPFAQFFKTGNWLIYLAQTVGVLIPIYALVLAVIYIAQSKHGESWRAWVESLSRAVPVLGKARRHLALARLCSALEALLSAGVNILEAWELAGAASGSPALRRTILAWRPQVDAGQTPAEVVGASSEFPPLFANQYATGEISGKLEDTLRGLQRYFQEDGSRKLHALAQWTPRVIYLAVALMIGYRVVHFYADYFNQISAAGGF